MNTIDFRFRPNTPEIINGIKNSSMFKAACKAIGFDRRKPQPLEDIVADLDRLDAELEKIRQLGYAASNSEHFEMVRGVAAPIRDHDHKVFASLSALGLVSRVSPEMIPEVAAQVIKVADEISRLFGYAAKSA